MINRLLSFIGNALASYFWRTDDELAVAKRAYRRLLAERITFLRLCFWLLVTVAILTILATLFESILPVAIPLNVVLAIMASISAAMIVELLAQYRILLDVQRQQELLREFFGIDDARAGVALVLPKYEVPLEIIRRKEVRGWKKLVKIERGESMREIEMCARPDLFAAASMVEAFSEVGLAAPRIIWDEEGCREIADPIGKYRVLIAIGLFSNQLVGWLKEDEQSYLNRWFDLVTEHERQDGATDDEIWLATCRNRLPNRERGTWERFGRTEGVSDHALVAKLRLPPETGGKTLIVLGGIGSTGTEAVGGYLRREWKNLLMMTDPETQKSVHGHEFALVIDVPKDKSKTWPTKKSLRVV